MPRVGTGAVEAFLKAGVDKDKLLSLYFGRGGEGAADATAEAVRRMPGETRRNILEKIIGAVTGGGQTIVGGLVGGGVAALPDIVRGFTQESPMSAVAGGPISSKYMITADVDLRLYPQYRRELFNTLALNKYLGLNLPLPTPPEELLSSMEGRLERQATGLNEREIAKIQAQREFDVALKELETKAAVQRAQIEAAANIRRQELSSGADIRTQELQSLGDVQRERLKSSYDFAKETLESAIQNVLQSGVVSDRSVQQELARIQ